MPTLKAMVMVWGSGWQHGARIKDASFGQVCGMVLQLS
jgi:hypothetical protein